MVKSYSGNNNFAKINKKHYNTPELLPDDPIYNGSLFDVLVKPDKKYVEQGITKQYKLTKLNNVKLPKSSYCYTNRFFVQEKRNVNLNFQLKMLKLILNYFNFSLFFKSLFSKNPYICKNF